MNPSKHSRSAYTNDRSSDGPRYGEIAECELCENERICTDSYGMCTCRHCQATFLP